MKRFGLFAVPLLTIGLFVGADQPVWAQPSPGADAVVARVGDSVITVAELERRMAKVPTIQLLSYGKTEGEIRRQFLERVLIPELLLSKGGLAKGFDSRAEVKLRERDLLKTALLNKVRDELIQPVTPQDVAAYYAQHRDRYQTSARYAVWRILVASREEAEQVIAQAKKDPSPTTWNALAREKSLDKSTNLRGGNLGFVTDSGQGADEKTQVAPALVQAVKQVKDGEIVDHPVPEGSGFAVLWRRGSMPEVSRQLSDEADKIAKILVRERAIEAQQKLVADLKARDLTNYNPAGTELLLVSSTGQLSIQNKPGRLERSPERSFPSTSSQKVR